MKRNRVTLLILFFCNIYLFNNTFAQITDPPKRIIAYFASWGDRPDKGNYGVDDIPWNLITHLNYAFAGVGSDYKICLLDSNISINNTYPGQDLTLPYLGQFNLLTTYQQQYNVKTLISIGGWAASGGFYEMTDTPQGMEVFANSCVAFLREYNFDGIDIDWEYPTSAAGAVHPLDDILWWNDRQDVIYERYVSLLGILREKIDQAKAEDGKDYLLTIAASGSSWTLGGMGLGEYCQLLDFVNIMSYDLHGAWNTYVGPQAALHPSQNDPETSMMDQPTLNIEWAVKYYSGYLSPDKINIGIPYYSRGWSDVSGGTNGLWGTAPSVDHTFTYDYNGETYTHDRTIGQGAGGIDGIWNDPSPEPDAGANPLWHILNLLENPGTAEFDYLADGDLSGIQSGISGYERYFDNETKSVYVWNSITNTFLTYEDTASLAHKLKFITDYGIGGMMFWELSGDYHYDNQKGYYTAGHDMTQFAYDFFNSVDIMEAPERILPDEYANFSHSFTGTYSHPNFSPEFTITNNTGSTIPGSWNLEFDLPKSARWESTWGTGTLSTIDESHPFLTRYRIVGPSWQSIPDGESATITGAIKLCFTNGPLNVVLNGKQSEDVFSNISSVEKSEDVSVYPNPTNGIVNISSNKTIRKITILSIDGQKIEEICNPKESMNLSHLDKGIYLLKIESSEKDEILKLIRY